MLRLMPWASVLLPRRDLHASQTLWNVLLLKQVKERTCIFEPRLADYKPELFPVVCGHDPAAKSQDFCPKMNALFSRPVPPKL